MATKFLIQSTEIDGKEVPAQDFGYTAMQVVDYHNWLCGNEKTYKFEFARSPVLGKQNPEWLQIDNSGFSSCIPIGSVEFVLAWFKAMGVDNVKPLNIPKALWKFCDRHITIDYCSNVNGHFMLKDINTIKASCNGEAYFHVDGGAEKKYFLSEWLNGVKSEWRVFVFNGKIQAVHCYSGDPWLLPNREYVQKAVNTYSNIRNTAYTLDVMVTDKKTEILELHDFFSCGLYGFEDLRILPLMWRRLIDFILRTYKLIGGSCK